MGYIYKITNQINGKIYIGQTTKSIEQRWMQHEKNAKQFPNRYLYDAMNHYGYDNFTIEVVEECEDCNLNNREKYWIAYFHSYYLDERQCGYNMTLGGDGGNTWNANMHKEETGRKISIALQRHIVSEETRKKISLAQKGHYEIDIDKEELLNRIERGDSIASICQDFQISESTIRQRCKDWFGKSYGQLRITPTKRKPYTFSTNGLQSKKDANKQRTGDKNPAYKNIDKEEFYLDIVQGMTLEDLSIKYQISKPTITKKCKEYFNKNVRELRKEKNND